MRPEIITTDNSAEYFTDELCHILELSNSSADPDVSVARARVEPGVTTKRHRVAGTIERYIVLEGTGRVKIEGLAARDVGPGSVVLIPAGAEQAVTNTSDHDLLFLCICTPRFEWDNYESLE